MANENVETEQSVDTRFDELEKDKVFLRKRKLTLMVIVLRMFLVGVEYAVMLPSIWLYLKRFNVHPWFLGVVVAINPAAGVLSLPTTGRVFDKTKRTRALIFITNIFEIFGNIVYSLGFSKWCVFLGRMFAGFGDGFYVIATSEIVFTYPVSRRTGIYSLLELGRFLGIVFGPVVNFLFAEIDFSIGSWRIDKGTSPGIFMAGLWIILQVIVMYFVSDLSRLIEEHGRNFTSLKKTESPASSMIDEKEEQETSLCDSGIEIATVDKGQSPLPRKHTLQSKLNESTGDVFVELHRGENGVTEKEVFIGDKETKTEEEYKERRPSGGYIQCVKPYLRNNDLFKIAASLCTKEILVLFYSDLVLWLAITEFELFLPLITQEEYGWKETETSIVYIVGGVWLMFVFFFIYKFGSKIKDQHFVTFSLLLTITASILLMCEQIPQTEDIKTRLSIFLVICVIVFTAIPLNMVAIKSLITKLTPEDTQGITQGVYNSLSRIATITGPVLAGVAFSNRVMFAFAMVILNLVALVGVVLSLTKIKLKIQSMLQTNL